MTTSTMTPLRREPSRIWNWLSTASWSALIAAVAFGIVGGAVTAWTGIGGESGDWTAPGYRPPLFFVKANFVYVISIVLAIPGLLRGFVQLLRRRYAAAAQNVFAFVVPLGVYLGFVYLSHEIGCLGIDLICRNGSFTGVSHLFHHTVVAAVPLLVVAQWGRWLLGRGTPADRSDGAAF